MIYAKAAFTIAYFILSKAYSECQKLKQSSRVSSILQNRLLKYILIFQATFFKSYFRMKSSLYLPLY